MVTMTIPKHRNKYNDILKVRYNAENVLYYIFKECDKQSQPYWKNKSNVQKNDNTYIIDIMIMQNRNVG